MPTYTPTPKTQAQKKTLRTYVSDLLLVSLGLLVALLIVRSSYILFFYSCQRSFAELTLMVLFTLTLSLCCGVLCVTAPTRGLLCLIAVFFNTVLIYLISGAEFLALVFLIVYIGAIAIIFLFVIRLLDLNEVRKYARVATSALPTQDRGLLILCLPPAATFVYALPLFLEAFLIDKRLSRNATGLGPIEDFQKFVSWESLDVRRFSSVLYSEFGYLFWITSRLLFTGRLGAIILATRASDLKIEFTRKG